MFELGALCFGFVPERVKRSSFCFSSSRLFAGCAVVRFSGAFASALAGPLAALHVEVVIALASVFALVRGGWESVLDWSWLAALFCFQSKCVDGEFVMVFFHQFWYAICWALTSFSLVDRHGALLSGSIHDELANFVDFELIFLSWMGGFVIFRVHVPGG